MRVLLITITACLLGACAAPKPVPRAALVPMYDLPPPPKVVARPDAPVVVPTVPVTQPAIPAPAVPTIYRTVVEVVEVPVEVEIPVEGTRESLPQRQSWPERRGYTNYDDYLRYRTSYRPYRRNRFPINTAVGAGIGAIIGHQHGRRDRGALIGGSWGLLMDLSRW